MHKAYPQKRLRLIVVGDGPRRSTLAQQLPDAVFCGAQRGEVLAEHYASGDLFLFPSLTETFGNVVLEAMAAGLAVVAYDGRPRRSIFATGTAVHWPCRATRRHLSMPPAGCWKKRKPCAGCA